MNGNIATRGDCNNGLPFGFERDNGRRKSDRKSACRRIYEADGVSPLKHSGNYT